MANEKVTALPTVSDALLSDIIYAVQGGVSVQETLQQVFNLMLANVVLNHAGDPNGLVAGKTFQLLWDTTSDLLWICTTSGNAATAVWNQVSLSDLVPVDPTHGGTGVSDPPIHTLPVAQGSANFNFVGPLGNGEILIGSSGSDPVPSVITAGSGISISNSTGSITISASGAAGFSWNVVSSPTEAMNSNNGYIVNDAGLVTLTLPTTATVGDAIIILGSSASGWTIEQNAGQTLHISGAASTTGAGGSVSSTNAGDSLTLICSVTDTDFIAASMIGNLTIV